MIFFLIIFAYVGYYYTKLYFERKKCPPGPFPIPILGNCIQLGLASDVPNLAIAKFSQDYGEIFTLKVGVMNLIVPATVEAINSTFSRPEAAGRDLRGSWKDRNFGKNLGIVFSDGPISEKSKAWLFRNLKEFGFGKSLIMETIVKKQIRLIVDKLDESLTSNNGIVDVQNLFVVPSFKVFWDMMVGHCTPEDELVTKDLLEKSEAAIKKGIFGAGLVNAFPIIRYIAPEYTGHAEFMRFYRSAHQAAKDLLRKTKKEVSQKSAEEKKSPTNLIESFAVKMEEEISIKDTIFTEENFIVIFMDVLQASSDTSSSYMESMLLFAILYPDVQAKIYDELTEIVSKGEEPTSSDRKKMIYTQVFMLEVHRCSKIVQNLVPRRVLQDFKYKNFLIPKGSIMVADLHSAFNNKIDFENPSTFSPERFIGKNGEIINQNKIMTFGLGTRLCPGESLAAITAFLFLTSLLKNTNYQLLQVHLDQGKICNVEPHPDLFHFRFKSPIEYRILKLLFHVLFLLRICNFTIVPFKYV